MRKIGLLDLAKEVITNVLVIIYSFTMKIWTLLFQFLKVDIVNPLALVGDISVYI